MAILFHDRSTGKYTYVHGRENPDGPGGWYPPEQMDNFHDALVASPDGVIREGGKDGRSVSVTETSFGVNRKNLQAMDNEREEKARKKGR